MERFATLASFLTNSRPCSGVHFVRPSGIAAKLVKVKLGGHGIKMNVYTDAPLEKGLVNQL